LLTLLEQAEEQGDRLSEEGLFATANMLMVAGHETTSNLIGNGLLALLRHPDQLQLLREEPGPAPQAVEELRRYDCPVKFVYRLAREDLEFGGRRIRPGQIVHLVLGAANRDPAHFPDPDRLDLRRTPNNHLAFTQGIHFCLGAPLARLEAESALTTVLRRWPGLRLERDRVAYRANLNMHGLTALPVRFSRGAAHARPSRFPNPIGATAPTACG
jgi:cytochrome P450